MQPVNVSDITAAVVKRLSDTPSTREARISRGEVINESPAMCPWVGVYRREIRYPIRVLGTPGGFRGQQVDLIVVVQEQDGTSGEQCEDRLELLISAVISALFDDPTLYGTCDTLDAVTVRYTSYEKAENAYMQTAFIYVTALTRAN